MTRPAPHWIDYNKKLGDIFAVHNNNGAPIGSLQARARATGVKSVFVPNKRRFSPMLHVGYVRARAAFKTRTVQLHSLQGHVYSVRHPKICSKRSVTMQYSTVDISQKEENQGKQNEAAYNNMHLYNVCHPTVGSISNVRADRSQQATAAAAARNECVRRTIIFVSEPYVH